MEIKIIHSKIEVETTIKFIAKNNSFFKGKHKEIRESIMEGMLALASDVESDYYNTMGFILVPDRDFEGLDSDENVCRISVYVDPSLAIRDFSDETDFQEQIIDVPNKEDTK